MTTLPPSQRLAFCLKIRSAEHIGTYVDRHNPIWPELTGVFVEHGVMNYSIFLNRKTLELFGYAEVSSVEQWEAIAHTGACRQWWDYMGDIMVNNADGTPWSQPLEEVFHHEIPRGLPDPIQEGIRGAAATVHGRHAPRGGSGILRRTRAFPAFRVGPAPPRRHPDTRGASGNRRDAA